MWFPFSLCTLSNVEEVFARMPRLDGLLHESGWATPAGWATAAACAQKLRRHHPAASVWAAAAAHNDSLLSAFFHAFATQPELAFVSGLATHMARLFHPTLQSYPRFTGPAHISDLLCECIIYAVFTTCRLSDSISFLACVS